MAPQSLIFKSFSQALPLSLFWFIVGLFTIITALEFSTPPDYVFGYLYIAPVLLASVCWSRTTTFTITFVAAFLTLLNLWVPGGFPIQTATIISRLVVILSLVVTGILSRRTRYYADAIAQQQVKLQAQAQLADVREDFALTLTHDLKTPLLGAIETLKALQEEYFGFVTAMQRKALTTMIRSHQTSLQLVETLLDIYRNDTEGLQLQLAPVDLVTLAEDTIDTLLDFASARRVYMRLSYGESDFRRSLWIKGDALQLQRVFTNLLTNAINHSVRGSEVEVIMESQAAYHVVKILDAGLGIREQEFPHLFERFFQGGSDRQTKGAGLGLYLTRQIIEAHDGSIWAENQLSPQATLHSTQALSSNAGGAIFSFRLPAFPAQRESRLNGAIGVR